MKPMMRARAMSKALSDMTSFVREDGKRVDVNERIEANVCSICKNEASGFRDDLSEKEFTMSGMCQACQDDYFGKGN